MTCTAIGCQQLKNNDVHSCASFKKCRQELLWIRLCTNACRSSTRTIISPKLVAAQSDITQPEMRVVIGQSFPRRLGLIRAIAVLIGSTVTTGIFLRLPKSLLRFMHGPPNA